MAIQASDPSVAKTEFRATLAALGIAQHRAAKLFGVSPRSIRRWQDGDRRVPAASPLWSASWLRAGDD